MPRWENGFQTSEEIQRYKRQAVIREAARAMSRHGYHNTSLDEIAKVLGISKGTLYNYIENKHEILVECHNISLDLGVDAYEYAQAQGGSGLDKLRLFLYCYLIWMHAGASIPGITFDVAALQPADRKQIIARRDQNDARMVELLEEAVSDGSGQVRDAKITVYAIMASINGISTWYAPDGRLRIEEIADIIIDTLTLSLATNKASLRPYPSSIPPPRNSGGLQPLDQVRTPAARQSETGRTTRK